jgi:CRP-like cAMP-binding protein
VVNTEQAGGFIGELAVLEPALRSARLRAGPSGARVLRLDGEAFTYALKAESSIATHVIRILAQRLRRAPANKK